MNEEPIDPALSFLLSLLVNAATPSQRVIYHRHRILGEAAWHRQGVSNGCLAASVERILPSAAAHRPTTCVSSYLRVRGSSPLRILALFLGVLYLLDQATKIGIGDIFHVRLIIYSHQGDQHLIVALLLEVVSYDSRPTALAFAFRSYCHATLIGVLA